MDTISGLSTHSKLESLLISPPTPQSSKSNITTQEQPDIANTPAGDIPPPDFINSINELRSYSTALSAFLSRYDELHNYINFIKSSIDSKLRNHVVDSTNPNQSALTHLFETSLPEVSVSDQNLKESASDCERSHAIARTPENTNFAHNYEEIDSSKMPEVVDVSKNREEIDISKKPVEIDDSKMPEVVDASKNPEVVDRSKKTMGIDTSKKPEEIDTLKKPEDTVPETSHDQTITAVPDAIISEENPNGTATNCEQRPENVRAPENVEEFDASKKPEQTDVLNKAEEIDILKKPKQTDICKNPDEIDVLQKPEQTDICMNPEEVDELQKPEETDTCMNPEEVDELQKPEETDACMNPEEIDVLHKPERTDICMNAKENDVLQKPEQTDICKNPEEVDVLQKPEETDICMNPEKIDILKKPEQTDIRKNPYEIDVLQKPEQTDICKNPEELDVLVKPEQTDICKNPDEIDILQKPEEIDASKIPEEIDAPKKHEETGIRKKAEEINASMKPEETEKPSKKYIISVLELLCQDMSPRILKKHISTHYFELNQLQEEITKALKLAKDPAELVLSSIGRFFMQDSKAYRKGSHKNDETVGRLASVLILECFVMISSDGIEIAKRDHVYAAKAAVDWRNRMIREGGLGHTDEVDARGLLLLISGFGIQDHVFKIQDLADLIRASNVKGISTALRRSAFLIPKIPEVIYLMVKNNLEIEAVDIAYTFGLEDTCHPWNILTSYLHNKINDIQNGSSSQMLEAMKQQLIDLKSVKLSLESHNVDPSTLLPDFKINEKIQNLEKEINEGESIQKRKSLENTIHHESKRACFSHENMPHQQKPVDHYGMNPEEIDVSQKPEQTDICMNPEEIDVLLKPEETDICMNPEEIDVLQKPEQTDIGMNPEEIDILQKPEEIDICKIPEEIDVLQKPEEFDKLKKPEQTDICENPEEIDVLREPGEIETSMNPEEIDTPKKHEETAIRKKTEEINASMKPLETGKTSNKFIIPALKVLCQKMNSKALKKHIAKHYSELNQLQKEIAKALKLAKDPAKLVLSSIGRFFMQSSKSYRKGSHQNDQTVGRLALVLILECFVMISSDGIEIAKKDLEYAAEAAVDWRNRMIREGGLGHTDEVDARGLLLLISGFGIQDHVFKIQDLVDLIRASNVKGISTALRRSAFLIPKVPEVIYLMVRNNLEIEAVDVAYTFGLEDMCHPRNILTTYLQNKINDIQHGSSFQMLEAMKQQLTDLKSVKQCLESHNVDPSKLLPDFKINEKIQNLEKEINEGKLIQKRKSLENPIHHESKRACFTRENMPHQQKPIDHYGTNPYNRLSQPRSSHLDFDRNHCNSYITNYSASSGSVPHGLARGFHGSYDPMVHPANGQPYDWHEPYGQPYDWHESYGQPYDWHEPYGQPYSRHGQTYDSQPYDRPRGWGPPESFPVSGGFPGRRGPSSDLYRFADIVEKESRFIRW